MLKFGGVFLGFFGVYLCFWVKNGDSARPYAQVWAKNGEKVVKIRKKSVKIRKNAREIRQFIAFLGTKNVGTCAFGRAKKTPDDRL